MGTAYRLAILTSHPIQYQAPLFRHLASRPEVDLTVLFCADYGIKAYHDPGFGAVFRWDVPLLEGYRHVFLRNRSPRPGVGRFWGLINPEVRDHIKSGRFDALVVRGWATATNWLAFGASRGLKLPVLLNGDSNGLHEPTGFRRHVKRNILTRLFRNTAGFLASGSLNRAFYRSYGADEGRIFHAPLTVDNDYFRGHDAALSPRRGVLRAEESILDDATVFLFCGKLSQVKRPLDALEAFARLPDARRCRLIFAGDGLLRGDVLSRAVALGLGDKVRVTGFLNQGELPRFYAMSDALVLPSGVEPWGLVVNEAMNFGLPVLASDSVGSGPDLVRGGENGFVFPTGDVASLAEKMGAIHHDRGLRAAMGGRSRDLISRWGIAETADGYLAALRGVAGVRPSAAGRPGKRNE